MEYFSKSKQRTMPLYIELHYNSMFLLFLFGDFGCMFSVTFCPSPIRLVFQISYPSLSIIPFRQSLLVCILHICSPFWRTHLLFRSFWQSCGFHRISSRERRFASIGRGAPLYKSDTLCRLARRIPACAFQLAGNNPELYFWENPNPFNTKDRSVAAEMQRIGVNFNQIARRVNSTSRIYEQDFDEIKRGIDEIWQLLRSSLSKARQR